MIMPSRWIPLHCLMVTLAGSLHALSLPRPDWVEGSAQWRGNATNADLPGNRLDGWKFEVRGAGATQRVLENGLSLRNGWQAGVEVWPEFTGFTAVEAEWNAGLSRKSGLGPTAAVWFAEVGLGGHFSVESLRRGVTVRGRIGWQKRILTPWRVRLGHEWVREETNGPAFDSIAGRWTLDSAWQLGPRSNWSLGGAWRSGDVVSYSRPPRPDLVKAGKKIVLLDAFRQETPFIAYYFRAETWSLETQVDYDWTRRLTLFGRAEYRGTRHGGSRYTNTHVGAGVRARW